VKVLFYSLHPFAFTHGGLQTQILQTAKALVGLGVEVEFLRWMDSEQAGDILHFFGRVPGSVLEAAQRKGIKVVLADLLTAQGARSEFRLNWERAGRGLIARGLPRFATEVFNWDSYGRADACVALTEWEAHIMVEHYGAVQARTHVVPNGVEEVFLSSKPVPRGPWLICTTTITARKRALELAEAAVRARTPLWIIGKPYSEVESYAKKFFALARAHPETLRYEGPIQDRAKLAQVYREARGFVLLSAMESLSLSALEAAACECPLLLSRLPWATTVFGDRAYYCPVSASVDRTAPFLRQFYNAAPTLEPLKRPQTWVEVGERLKRLYEGLLSGRR
jgi:glycosyltransferase involved in cell wall biosynthesis